MEEINKTKESILFELRADWPLTIKEIKFNLKQCHPDYCLECFDVAFNGLLGSKEVIEYDPLPNCEVAFMPNYD
jgi:hypothetical protein